jgi:diphthine-ammonia ligase
MASALVSGGKDSIYSASLAEAQGWPVDELLVIAPRDADSFLFHTPNLDLVELQGRAWGKPVRTVPVDGVDEAAEVEALRRGLATGKGPVIAGAIASAYQWARLSRITYTLGRPLYAPLWGKEPRIVVRAEIDAGLDIRIVQVAAEGLGAELLGERLDLPRLEALDRLSKGPRPVHPAGEGGEFETLVVDAPFFRERIILDETERTLRGLAGRLDVRRAHLAPKGSGTADEGRA